MTKSSHSFERPLLLVLGFSLFTPACRKAEPEEIVNALQGSGGGPALPPPPTGTGGAAPSGTGGAPGGSGSGGEPVIPADAGDGGGAGGAPTVPELCEVPPPVLDGPFSKRKLIEAAVACAEAHYCRFLGPAQVLRDRTEIYEADPSLENRAAARDAFRSAMAAWQEAELFRFGPAAGASSPGGRNLRDLIYSFPQFGRCKVDEQTVSRFYDSPLFSGTPAESVIAGRSLAAVEYLLFYEGTDNGCSYLSPINSGGSWNALGADLVPRKAAYAAAAAADVFDKATDLVNAWLPEHGDFRSVVTSPGSGNTLFPSEQAVLNAVSEALFYVDVEFKDKKLGIPLGIHGDCPSASCPTAFESIYSYDGTHHLRANLRAARRLFQGCGENFEGIGFDDWLRAAGASDLADEMLAALDGADAAAAALGPMLPTDLQGATALHTAIRGFTTLLKADFLSALQLEESNPAPSDND